MSKSESRPRKRVLLKILMSVSLFLVVIASLAYGFRFKIVERYLVGNKMAQTMVAMQIGKGAEPLIERNVRMNFLEVIISFLAGRRDQEARQIDALVDVRAFSELAFKNDWLRFRDVHRLASLNGFDLSASHIALVWDRGEGEEVVAAFQVDFLKAQPRDVRINEECSFFAEMMTFVEKRARAN